MIFKSSLSFCVSYLAYNLKCLRHKKKPQKKQFNVFIVQTVNVGLEQPTRSKPTLTQR